MTKTSDVGAQQSKPTRAKVVAIGLVPVALGVIATALMLSWLPELPDPIAIHWGGAGADGFGPAVPFVLLPALIALVVCGGAVSMAWRPSASGRLSWNQKIVVVLSVWISTLISGGFGAGVAMQRGLVDAREAPDVGTSLALAAALGIVLAAAAWFILPPGESVDVPGSAARPVNVRGDERVSWSKSARIGTTPMLLIGLVILVALATVAASVLASPAWTLHGTVTIAVVVALAVTNFWWRVSADRRGFIAKGLLGWPRKRISLDRIRSVRVVEVHPTRDFGGWGWRWAGDGRSGILLFSGQGIEVTQLNGKRFVVTVEDAKTGAGVLAALLARRSRS